MAEVIDARRKPPPTDEELEARLVELAFDAKTPKGAAARATERLIDMRNERRAGGQR